MHENHVCVCVLGGNVCDEDLDLDLPNWVVLINTQAQQVINKRDFYTILQICNSTCYECYMTICFAHSFAPSISLGKNKC